MVTVEQWEGGKVKLIDEVYYPEFAYSTLDVLRMYAGVRVTGKLIHYIGASGIILSPEFFNVLEVI